MLVAGRYKKMISVRHLPFTRCGTVSRMVDICEKLQSSGSHSVVLTPLGVRPFQGV